MFEIGCYVWSSTHALILKFIGIHDQLPDHVFVISAHGKIFLLLKKYLSKIDLPIGHNWDLINYCNVMTCKHCNVTVAFYDNKWKIIDFDGKVVKEAVLSENCGYRMHEALA